MTAGRTDTAIVSAVLKQAGLHFDIACGVACGFRTIAVATGTAYSFDELDGHRPDFLLRDLGELPRLAGASGASPRTPDAFI